MPCIEDIKTLCNWTIKISTTDDLLPIASGNLIKLIERKDASRLYVFKTEVPLNSQRFGFCLGNFRCATAQDHPLVYYFAITKKGFDWIEAYLIAGKVIKDIIEMLETVLGHKMRTKLSLVFMPNIGEGLGNFRKLSIMHAGLILLDERFLLNHNVIEYRYKFNEALAEVIAFKFFGGKFL